MVGDGLLLHVLMGGDLIPGVQIVKLVKLVNTEEQTPLSADSRVPALMMNSLLSLSLTKVTVRPTAQLAGVHCAGLITGENL